MDQRIIDLYDEFTHGTMSRRRFFDRLAALAGSTAAASALLPLLQNNYALAQMIAETDARITAATVAIPGVDKLTGYLVRPKAAGRHPAVIVIHENRGLNPHIKDVTRRLGTEGFLALGVDCLSPLGGTPSDEDKARSMISELKPGDAIASLRAALAMLKSHPESNSKVGAVGFCWGGAFTNWLAATDPTLDAAVPYYGRQPTADVVPNIRAPLMLHYAENDPGVNAGIAAYEAALKAAGKSYELHMYPGAQHAFNNDTGPARYNKEAADLAWSRTLAFFRKHLGETVRS
ncbi:MAG TPA: dienelactone hydrolase family protein [Alphaproteobacteria bacterium]|nr:dienelactone hydrolase family protein [Alphaproteobacteria bacterium]